MKAIKNKHTSTIDTVVTTVQNTAYPKSAGLRGQEYIGRTDEVGHCRECQYCINGTDDGEPLGYCTLEKAKKLFGEDVLKSILDGKEVGYYCSQFEYHGNFSL